MPVNLLRTGPDPASAELALGPQGPFPRAELHRVLERRWLHYAFLSRDGRFGLVANIAQLGSGPRGTSILLLFERGRGWVSSQFNARTVAPLWSAFRVGAPGERFAVSAVRGEPTVDLTLRRTSRPCTSQCAPFAGHHHLRWQSETGVVARGPWSLHDCQHEDIEAVGYHERVRGYWGWPELGGWVFGFANDPGGDPSAPPRFAIVFTLIQPVWPAEAATASVMLWRDGRMVRHFPRRRVSVAVRGAVDKTSIQQVPALARVLGVPPMTTIPRRLMVHAAMGDAAVLLDFECDAAARVVIPSETSIGPFSVHEAIGPVAVEGRIGSEAFAFATAGIVEFAGGAIGD